MKKGKKRSKAPERQKPTDKEQARNASDASSATNENEENPFDFGGIPARDLKKNLGCG